MKAPAVRYFEADAPGGTKSTLQTLQGTSSILILFTWEFPQAIPPPSHTHTHTHTHTKGEGGGVM